jgi:hypothetical protein
MDDRDPGGFTSNKALKLDVAQAGDENSDEGVLTEDALHTRRHQRLEAAHRNGDEPVVTVAYVPLAGTGVRMASTPGLASAHLAALFRIKITPRHLGVRVARAEAAAYPQPRCRVGFAPRPKDFRGLRCRALAS